VKVWTQIAKYFSNHGEELLFESMNEIHDGYGNPDPRHFTFINELNQEFVKVVRSSGGNNDKRHLIVPGYNTNIDHTLKGFKLPTDTVEKRLIVSVHYYDPYLFALQGKVNTWGKASPGADNWGQEDFVVTQFDKVKAAFIDKGVPVFLGESGATHQEAFQDYRRYYVEYVTKAAVDRGILPVWWDNGGKKSGGESFALIDRDSNSVLHPKLMEAMLRAAKNPYVSPIIVAVTLAVGNVILLESVLSFLGLGIQPPMASWGNMLTNAQETIWEAPMLAIWPGLFIFITVMCFNFLGDGLQDAFDPKAEF
jgi:endoglucanase